MSRLPSATLLAATLLTAAGCATPAPGGTLGATSRAAAGPALTTGAAIATAPAPAAALAAPVRAAAAPTVTTREVVLSPSARTVTVVDAAGKQRTTELEGPEADALLSDLGGRAIDPQEADAERVAAELAVLEAPPSIARLATAYTAAVRTDAQGQASIQTSYETDPVYLSPRYFPVLLPGSPSTLPAFTPRQLDGTKLPTDAFSELDRLRRIREAKDTWLPWLFGKKFLAIDAALAKTRLGGGEHVWIGPDGSRWHRDKSFVEISDAAQIDAMLPQLRDDALTDQARTIRLANIKDRATLLPGFNRNYDIYKLLLLDLIADDYNYGGQPIRRGILAAANFYEIPAVRSAIATYWEDHPETTAAELRLATNRVLVQKFQDIGQRADSIAGDPQWYTEGQMIPGLRAPRPRTADDDWGYKTDVAYNRAIILQLSRTMPAVLSSSLY